MNSLKNQAKGSPWLINKKISSSSPYNYTLKITWKLSTCSKPKRQIIEIEAFFNNRTNLRAKNFPFPYFIVFRYNNKIMAILSRNDINLNFQAFLVSIFRYFFGDIWNISPDYILYYNLCCSRVDGIRKVQVLVEQKF